MRLCILILVLAANCTLAQADRVIHVVPASGTQIEIPELSVICKSAKGCEVEILAQEKISFHATSLVPNNNEFVGWKGGAVTGFDSDDNDEWPWSIFRVETKYIDFSSGETPELRSVFRPARFLSFNRDDFAVSFKTAPDWISANFYEAATDCVDRSYLPSDQDKEADPSLENLFTIGNFVNNWSGISTVDMTGDGLKELLIFNSCGDWNFDLALGVDRATYLTVLQQLPHGGFAPANEKLFGKPVVQLGEMAGEVRVRFTGDINQDGYPDLILFNDRDGGNDGVAEPNWQRHFETDAEYPLKGKNWAGEQFVILSRGDGSYEALQFPDGLTPAQNWLIADDAGYHYLVADPDCGFAFECTTAQARQFYLFDSQDITDEVFVPESAEGIALGNPPQRATTYQFANHRIQWQSIDPSAPFHPDGAAQQGKNPTRLIGFPAGGIWFNERPWLSVSRWLEQAPERNAEGDRNCNFGISECTGLVGVGGTVGPEITGFYHNGVGSGLEVNSVRILANMVYSNHWISMAPDKDPILISLTEGWVLHPDLKLDEGNNVNVDLQELAAKGECPSGLLYGIDDGTNGTECQMILDFPAQIPVASKLTANDDLEVLPLAENPFFNAEKPWLETISTWGQSGGKPWLHNVMSEFSFFDANGDGYTDFAEWLFMRGQYESLCPEAHQNADSWGIKHEECRYLSLFVNNRQGRLERVEVTPENIPMPKSTTLQRYVDLNGDGLMDIVNYQDFTRRHGRHKVPFTDNEQVLSVYFGREDSPAAATFSNLLCTIYRRLGKDC
jgi:hypothetical protein